MSTTTFTVKRALNVAETTALRMLGFTTEERGGDATRSTFRNARVRRTRLVTLIGNTDGSPMTDEAKKTVSEVVR